MNCKGWCGVHKVAAALVIIGAINWGLVGVFGWNLVSELLGNWEWAERAVYILVGVSGLSMIGGCYCKYCKK